MKLIGILIAITSCFLAGCNRGPQTSDAKGTEEKTDVPLKSRRTYRGSLEPLNAYRGKELAKLDDLQAKELLGTVTRLVPDRTYQFWFDFRPWHVWEFPNKGQPVLLLFEVDNTGPHPGSTSIRITVFEKIGKTFSESTFATGNRCYLHGVSLEKQTDEHDPLIALETGCGPGPGPNFHKQVYARFGNRFDLVRLESADGKATRNLYYVNHFACGPEVPKQSPQEWEADVFSRDRFRILRALVWLSGAHWKGQPAKKLDRQFEPVENLELVRQVRARQKVADKLKALTASEDRWVREAAVLAADPEDERW
jgi:hypothetical protein